jgi:hypothetical protein
MTHAITDSFMWPTLQFHDDAVTLPLDFKLEFFDDLVLLYFEFAEEHISVPLNGGARVLKDVIFEIVDIADFCS